VTAPTFLNTQVLPLHLKQRAEKSILAYKEKILLEKSFDDQTLNNLSRHIDDHLKHMFGRDWSHLIPALKDYTKRLDNKRNTDVLASAPELAEIFI
jgi:hypothetical protein